jgi:hypothetical protein
MTLARPSQAIWGFLGAATAATFSAWMFLFPDTVASYFAWDVHPRYTQAFIGAGYLFRTFFFLNAARERDWTRLRWIVWGNLAFTGTLLFATYWHVDEFHWDPTKTPLAHLWIVLYIFEPVAMLYLIPRGALRAPGPQTGGPILPLFRRYLVLVAGLLLMFGLALVFRPDFVAERWPWQLNDLDARIVAAWFLGWAIWSGTMAFAIDWDEIRTAAGLFLLNGLALIATAVVFGGELLPRPTAGAYAGMLVLMTGAMAAFFVLQERRRPMAAAVPVVAPT